MRARVAVGSTLACGAAVLAGAWLLSTSHGDRDGAGTRDVGESRRPPALATAAKGAEGASLGGKASRIFGRVVREGDPATADVVAFASPSYGTTEDAVRRSAWDLASPAGRARAEVSGRFAIEGLQAGVYEVVARSADGLTGGRYASLVVPGEAAFVEIHLRGGPHALFGSVRRPDGSSWSGRVAAEPCEHYATAALAWFQTDAEGRFRIEGLERGMVRLHLTPDAAHRHTTGVIRVPRSEPYDVLLPALVERRGVTVDAMNGRPVPLARVLVERWDDVSVETRADAEGRFAIAGPPDGVFHATAAGYVPASHRAGEDGAEVRVPLVPCGSVRGRVTRVDDASPVEGVGVFARTEDDGAVGAASTDLDGRYILSALPPGEVTVYAYGNGWSSPGFAVWKPGDADTLAIAVPPRGVVDADRTVEALGTVRGRILRPDGDAVAADVWWEIETEAEVPSRLWSLTEATSTTSAEDGSYEVRVPPGALVVVSAGIAPFAGGNTGPLRLAPGQTLASDIRLVPGRFVEVAVVDASDGAPVGGALVCAWTTTHGDCALTGERGVARVGPLPPGDVTATVQLNGYDASGEVALEEGVSVIRLRRVRVIEGNVVDTEGRAASGVYVLFRKGSTLVGYATVADGRFRCDRFQAAPETIQVVARGDWEGERALATKQVDDQTTRVDLVIPTTPETPDAPEQVVVRIVGPDGAPVPSARVAHADSSISEAHQGVARLRLAAERRLVVYRPRSAAGLPLPLGALAFGPVAADAEEVVVPLPAERRIDGIVRSADGRHVAGVLVRAVPSPWPEPFQEWTYDHGDARTGVDGRFSIGGLWEGDYDLVVGASQEYGAARVRAVSGAAGVEVVLAAATRIAVTVLDYEGRPVPRCDIEVQEEDGSRSATTDATGTVHVALSGAPTRRALRITPPGTRSDLRPFVRTRWRPMSQTVSLEHATSLRGRVVDDRGADVAGAIVRARDVSGEDVESRSRADGRFSVSGLRFGPIRVVARHAEASVTRACVPVVVPEGVTDVVLVLRPTRSLRVVVEGVPHDEGWLTLRETTRGDIEKVALDAEGRCEVRVVPDGTYDAWVLVGEGEATLQALVRGVSGRTQEMRLPLEPGGTASGRLVAPVGLDPDLSLADGFPIPAFDVDPDAGTWRVRGLPPGRWRVRATAEDADAQYEGFADVADGVRADIELRPK